MGRSVHIDRLKIEAPFLEEDPDPYPTSAEGMVYSCGLTMPHDLIMVTSASKKRLRSAVEQYARYFQREFQYDAPGYLATEDASQDDLRSFLWIEKLHDRSGYCAVGGCSFRRRKYDFMSREIWGLSWINLHPYRRRRGLFGSAWGFFTAMFQPLDIEEPISGAMERFLANKPTVPYFTKDNQQWDLYIYNQIETLN